MSEAQLAPAGWGYVPGMPIVTNQCLDLPDVVTLREADARTRNAAIVAAIRAQPDVAAAVTAADLRRKYEVEHKTSHELLQRIQKPARDR